MMPNQYNMTGSVAYSSNSDILLFNGSATLDFSSFYNVHTYIQFLHLCLHTKHKDVMFVHAMDSHSS